MKWNRRPKTNWLRNLAKNEKNSSKRVPLFSKYCRGVSGITMKSVTEGEKSDLRHDKRRRVGGLYKRTFNNNNILLLICKWVTHMLVVMMVIIINNISNHRCNCYSTFQWAFILMLLYDMLDARHRHMAKCVCGVWCVAFHAFYIASTFIMHNQNRIVVLANHKMNNGAFVHMPLMLQ